MKRSMEEWAEDHGYQRSRCPICKRTFYTDSNDPCPHCGPEEGPQPIVEAQIVCFECGHDAAEGCYCDSAELYGAPEEDACVIVRATAQGKTLSLTKINGG